MKESHLSRRDMLKTSGAIAFGAASAQAATGQSGANRPTVYVGDAKNKLWAIDASSGESRWALSVGEPVRSSPTVADGTVYVGAGNKRLYAVNAANGEVKWVFTDAGASIASSPTVVRDTVYILSDDGTLFAVGTEFGSQRWRFDTQLSADGSAPAFHNETVFVVVGGQIFAVDAASGSERWTTSLGDTVRSSPTVVNGTVYVGSRERTIVAIDAETGGEQWALHEAEDGKSDEDDSGGCPTCIVVPGFDGGVTPTVNNGTIYAASDSKLYAIDTEQGQLEWSLNGVSDSGSAPTVANGTVYVGEEDGTLIAVDTSSGREKWRLSEPTAPIRSSPTVGDGTVYVGTNDRNLYALNAETGRIEWVFNKPNGVVFSSPTFVKNQAGASTGSRNRLQTLGHYVPPEDPFFTVEAVQATATTGVDLGVTAKVANTGGLSDTQSLTFQLGSVSEESTTVELGGGSETTVAVKLPTEDANPGEYTLKVSSEDDSASTTVSLGDPSSETDDDTNGTDDPKRTESSGDAGTDNGSSADNNGTNGETDNAGGSEDDNTLSTALLAVLGFGTAGAVGAYALKQRGLGDTIIRPSSQASPDRVGSTTNGSSDADSQSLEDVNAELERGDTARDKASKHANSDKYDSAIELYSDAHNAYERAKKQSVGVNVVNTSEINSRIDEVKQEKKQVQYAQIKNRVEEIGAKLDRIDEIDNPETTRQQLRETGSQINSLLVTAEELGFEDLREQLETHDEHRNQLRADLPRLSSVPKQIPTAPEITVSYEELKEHEQLGSGGNADVTRTTLMTSKGEVTLAIKKPRLSGTITTEMVDRLLNEAETWQELDDHDHIVDVVDYGAEPLPWIAMEYMDAGNLGERAEGMLFDQALWTATATANAVRYAHSEGVVHLDLKPENILFRSVEDAWDVPKIADWGLAKHLLDHSGSVEGFSPHYAAPEQFDKTYGQVDDLTDIYQLGVVFYELFTGEPPFQGDPARVMNEILTESPTPPSEIADVPPALDDILLTAMATDPADRYETVVHLRNELEDLADWA